MGTTNGLMSHTHSCSLQARTAPGVVGLLSNVTDPDKGLYLQDCYPENSTDTHFFGIRSAECRLQNSAQAAESNLQVAA